MDALDGELTYLAELRLISNLPNEITKNMKQWFDFNKKEEKKLTENMKATIALTVAGFAVCGINYLTMPIVTGIISTSEYGLISLYNSWYEIIAIIASLTLIKPDITNVGLYNCSDNRWKYLSSVLGLTAVSTAALAVIYILFAQPISEFFKLPHSLMILMLISCCALPATTVWRYKQRYEYKYVSAFIVVVGSALAAQIISIAAVWEAKKLGCANLAVVKLWSAAAVNVPVAAVIYVYICQKGRKLINFPLWKTTLLTVIPLIPHYLGFAVFHASDKIMISRMVSTSKAGIYSLSAEIATIGMLFWSGLSVSVTPFMHKHLGMKKFNAINTLLKPAMLFAAAVCIAAALAAPEIIRILATKEYLEGVYAAPAVAVGLFMAILYDMFSCVTFFNKKTVMVMIATITAAITNVVLNYVFIKRFGYIAAGYTTFLSNAVLAGMHYWNVRIMEKKTMFDIKFILKLSTVVTVSCMLCNLLYDGYIIRYALLCVLLMFIWKNNRKFMHTLSLMKV